VAKRQLSDVEALREMGRRMGNRRPDYLIEAAEKMLRIRTREGQLKPLIANPSQRMFEERCGRQNIVLKARQMGITTWVSARFFLRTITTPGTLTLQVAHTREAAESIFATVRRMWEGLPQDLREGPLRLSRANAGQMVFGEVDSEFRVSSAAELNAGRGLSVQNLHCSEVSRWPGDARMTLAGLRAALAPHGEMVLESTPNGAYGAFYEEWCAATDDANVEGQVVRHFFPWWMEPTYCGPVVDEDAMTAEERGLVTKHCLSAEKIGFRRGLERTYGLLRAQEFAEDPENCFRTTGACCFDVDTLEQRMREAPEPVERRRNGALQVWLKPIAGRDYVVAVDSAGGGNDGDFAAVQIVEVATGLQCAELRERLRPEDLARVSVELAKEYSGALVAVERNNHGAAVLAYIETRESYRRVYKQYGEPGWLTSAASKPEIIARMGVLLSETPGRFMSKRLLAECRTFVADERGRAAAAAGSHDDLVMAMAIAQAVRAETIAWRGRASGARTIRGTDARA
jgi:hypothetical protein